MSVSDRLDLAEERRQRILDAAEHCFVRTGFHRTTMQDVAAACGMSPGNLYRYFPSKDAIVAGLAGRDRADVAEDFSTLRMGEDLMADFGRLARQHLSEAPVAKAVLCLEMWAEATRNATVAQLCGDFERELAARLGGILREARDRTVPPPGFDPEALARLVMMMADGIVVRRALVPDFDPAPAVDAMLALVEASLAGRFDPSSVPPDRVSA